MVLVGFCQDLQLRILLQQFRKVIAVLTFDVSQLPYFHLQLVNLFFKYSLLLLEEFRLLVQFQLQRVDFHLGHFFVVPKVSVQAPFLLLRRLIILAQHA